MIPMTDPMLQLMQAMRAGGSPAALLQQMAGQNPQVRQALQMMQGKTPDQLRQMAQNMARERNVDINQLLRQFGMTPPGNR